MMHGRVPPVGHYQSQRPVSTPWHRRPRCARRRVGQRRGSQIARTSSCTFYSRHQRVPECLLDRSARAREGRRGSHKVHTEHHKLTLAMLSNACHSSDHQSNCTCYIVGAVADTTDQDTPGRLAAPYWAPRLVTRLSLYFEGFPRESAVASCSRQDHEKGVVRSSLQMSEPPWTCLRCRKCVSRSEHGRHFEWRFGSRLSTQLTTEHHAASSVAGAQS